MLLVLKGRDLSKGNKVLPSEIALFTGFMNDTTARCPAYWVCRDVWTFWKGFEGSPQARTRITTNLLTPTCDAPGSKEATAIMAYVTQKVQGPELRRPFKQGCFLRPFTRCLRAFYGLVYGLFTGCLQPLAKGVSYSGRGSSGSYVTFASLQPAPHSAP